MVKKIFITYWVFILAIHALHAQNYYIDTVVYGENAAYNVSESGTTVFLRNRLNIYGDNGIVLARNGKPLKDIFMMYITHQSVSEKRIQRHTERAIFKTFNKQELGEIYSYLLWVAKNGEKMIKEKKQVLTDNVWIGYWVSPKGRVFELRFISFPKIEPFTEFPPDRYYVFEQNIKKHIRFRLKTENDMEQASRFSGMCLVFPNVEDPNRRILRLIKRYGRDYSYLLE